MFTDPWDWSVKEDDTETNKELVGPGTSWLDECCVSLSPTGELLVVTHKQCMVILTCKCSCTSTIYSCLHALNFSLKPKNKIVN